MLFNEVLAQDDIKDSLLKSVEGGRLPHAMLFLGPTGYGTLSMAVALAQYLLCTNRHHSGPCGQCNHCHKAQQYIHPDIHFTYPTIGSKTTSGDFLNEWRAFLKNGTYQDVQDWYRSFDEENKQGNITKAECDRILRLLGLKTYEGSHKILIIWMTELLGEMGNRLLKILEEPPDNTVFILLAESQESILNTILSRCQIIAFKPVPDQILSEYLQKRCDLDHESATQISFLARGNVNSALMLMEHANQKIADQWLDWMRLTYKGSGLEFNQWVDQFAKLNRESQKAFMYYGIHFLREMLLFNLSPEREIQLLEKETQAMIKMSNLVNHLAIESMIKLIEENIFHLERNINSKILMLDSSIRIHYLLRNKEASLKAMLTL